MSPAGRVELPHPPAIPPHQLLVLLPLPVVHHQQTAVGGEQPGLQHRLAHTHSCPPVIQHNLGGTVTFTVIFMGEWVVMVMGTGLQV